MPRNGNIVTATDRSSILEYVSTISDSMANIIRQDAEDSSGNSYSYLLVKKSITHSDVITAGKGNENTGVARNYLYYLTVAEMEELERLEDDTFIRTAHQSNISMPAEFYEFLGIQQIQRREGHQTTQHEHPIINNYASVYLVNDSLKYFDIDYTKEVFDKLRKVTDWNYQDYKVDLSNDDFTPIQLTIAVHGIGAQSDIEFHKLRRSIFRGDNLVLLLRKVNNRMSLYIMLEKNPKFYTIIGEGNSSWESYLEQNNKRHLFELLKNENQRAEDNDTKTRKYQNQWRQMLAREMMNYTPNDNEVFCPLTYITADFTKVGALFRASHIKEYSNCDINEAFDINNGILMIANADALFDKHLITIDDEGNVIFSFLLQNNGYLIQQIKLNEKVFKAILNPDRCRYLAYHRRVFEAKEARRRTTQTSLDELDEEDN